MKQQSAGTGRDCQKRNSRGIGMQELALNEETINKIKMEVPELVKSLMKDDLVEVVLYGSCARGDYTEDSDIDIALITKSDCLEAQKYNGDLARIATELAVKYFAIVNFVCLPYKEFMEKKSWYAYFKNVDKEGEILYES